MVKDKHEKAMNFMENMLFNDSCIILLLKQSNVALLCNS